MPLMTSALHDPVGEQFAKHQGPTWILAWGLSAMSVMLVYRNKCRQVVARWPLLSIFSYMARIMMDDNVELRQEFLQLDQERSITASHFLTLRALSCAR